MEEYEIPRCSRVFLLRLCCSPAIMALGRAATVPFSVLRCHRWMEPVQVRSVRSSALRLSEAGPPCGTKCATPTQCTDSSTKADIAHKAVGSAGATYGYSKKYAEGWERIFARRKNSEVKEDACSLDEESGLSTQFFDFDF
eukprot:s1595_g11.t2